MTANADRRPPEKALACAAALLALLAAGPAGGQEAPAAPAAGEQAPTTVPSETQALIDVLEDEAARGRLIEHLKATVGEGPAAPAPEAAPSAAAGLPRLGAAPAAPQAAPAAPEAAPASAAAGAAPSAVAPEEPVGTRLLGTVYRSALAVAEWPRADWNALRATVRRLGGLGAVERDALRPVLSDVLLLAAVSLAVAFIGRALVTPLFRRIGEDAARSGLVRKSALSLLAILVDLAVVLAAAVAAAALMIAAGRPPAAAEHRELFLAAFAIAGVLVVGVRAVFSPATHLMRPIPMSDAKARYWSWHLSVVVVLITFGEILVRPVVVGLASPITAHGSLVAIQVVALLYLATLVVADRNAPGDHFQRLSQENPDDVALPILAWLLRYWHYPALGMLLIVLHRVLVAGEGGLTLLFDAALLAAITALAVLAVGLLNRLFERGVRLPESLNRAVPALEPRLDGFVRPFLRLLRVVVLVLWFGFVLQVLGVIQPWDWLEARLGVDILGAALTLFLVVCGGFLVWLLISSWIDYRLAPRGGEMPSARERTLFSLLRNAALVVILVLGLSYGLSSVGISVAPLLASAGVVGLAIGFGSQKLVQDIITGVFIQFENAINVGDVVEVAGKIGSVEKLTIRSVSLRDVQGVYHIIPFSSVDAVSNYMKGFSYHVADISVAYNADIDAAKAAMLAAYDELAADPEWKTKLLGGVEWFGVEGQIDSAVKLRVRLKTRPGEQWGVGRAYTELVKRRFDAQGIEIAYPQMRLAVADRAAFTAPSEAATRQTISADAPTDADSDR